MENKVSSGKLVGVSTLHDDAKTIGIRNKKYLLMIQTPQFKNEVQF